VDEPVPDDLETSSHYIAIPHKHDLDLGRDLVLRFAARAVPGQYDRIEGFFQRRGAYARFRDLLSAEGRLEEWYNFEAKSREMALREWCEANAVAIIRRT
jgi:hypothetical protein